MQLRPLAPGDIPAAVALSRACREQPADQVGSPAWLTEADFHAETGGWQAPAGERFLAAAGADGALAGFVGVAANGDEAVLHGPIVAPAYRGRGLGRALLDAALATAAGMGTRTVAHSVGDDNARGQALLAAAGFTPATAAEGLVLLDIRPGELHRPAPVAGASCELAGAEDVRGIQAICQGATPRQPVTAGAVRAWCASPGARVFTIRHGGQLAGFARLDLRPPLLYQVTMAPGRREPGLGAMLGAHALQEGWRLLGPRPIGAAVPAGNADALHLFERLGFRRPLRLRFFSRPAGAPVH